MIQCVSSSFFSSNYNHPIIIVISVSLSLFLSFSNFHLHCIIHFRSPPCYRATKSIVFIPLLGQLHQNWHIRKLNHCLRDCFICSTININYNHIWFGMIGFRFTFLSETLDGSFHHKKMYCLDSAHQSVLCILLPPKNNFVYMDSWLIIIQKYQNVWIFVWICVLVAAQYRK